MASEREDGYYWVRLLSGQWEVARLCVHPFLTDVSDDPRRRRFYFCGNELPLCGDDLAEIGPRIRRNFIEEIVSEELMRRIVADELDKLRKTIVKKMEHLKHE